jgi:hypothetical protein
MRKYQPAILGGIFIGVLSALPYVNAANCCCLWVIAGGALVVYLQQQASPTPVATSDAAIGGLIAGALGGVILTAAQALLMKVTGPMILEQMRSQSSQMPPEAMEWMERIFSGSGIGLFMLMTAVCVPVFAIFAMGGSFLGLAIFRKKVPPQPQV